MVRPDFFMSESLAECSHSARLAFIGLWVMGDDNGNQKLSIRKLNRQIFPDDGLSAEEFAGLLGELERQGCIRVYEAEGQEYLNVTNFGVYQYVRNPAKSSNPEPPKGLPKRTGYFARRGANTVLTQSCHSANTALTPKKEGKKEASSPLGGLEARGSAGGPADQGPAAVAPEEVDGFMEKVKEALR